MYKLSKRKIEYLSRKCPPLIFSAIFSSNSDVEKLKDTIAVSSHWKRYKQDFVFKVVDDQVYISTSGVAELAGLNLKNFIRQFKNQISCLIHYFKFSKNFKIISQIIHISVKSRRVLCFDMTKHGILFDKLSKETNLFTENSHVTIIGDGFGFAGSLIKKMYPKIKVHFHNLSFNNRLDLLFSSLVLSKSQLRDITFTFAEDSNLEKSDVYLNIASFGEMTNEQIELYFNSIRTEKATLICLNRENKMLPGGEITSFNEYGWKEGDKILVDEIANFYTENPADKKKFEGRFLLRVAELA